VSKLTREKFYGAEIRIFAFNALLEKSLEATVNYP
jgi:hypothetical protein